MIRFVEGLTDKARNHIPSDVDNVSLHGLQSSAADERLRVLSGCQWQAAFWNNSAWPPGRLQQEGEGKKPNEYAILIRSQIE